MVVESDLLITVHLLLLVGFVGITSLLLLVTVTNRLRLRRVLLSWPSGKFFGLPIWPVVFLAAVVFLFTYSIFSGHSFSPAVFAGYITGGVFWLISSFLSSTKVISEYGIILNTNCADRAIAWGQVVDYFRFSNENNSGYVFFYSDGNSGRQRLDLVVPPACAKRFQEIVSAKLDTRFDFAVQQAFGKKALEG